MNNYDEIKNLYDSSVNNEFILYYYIFCNFV